MRPKPPSHPARNAFTLVELLTVIAIIGILAAIIIPTVARVRTQARLAQATSNLRQTGIAMALYVDDNRGYLPGRNDGSNLGVGDKGLSGDVKARFTGDVWRLAPHLAPYVNVTGASGIEKNIPCLEDPLAVSRQSAPSANPILWVLNRRLTQAWFPALSREVKPFGTKDADPPERYETITSSVAPTRVWAMIQADLKIPADNSLITAGTVDKTPAEPVGGKNRIALFFDWSVGRIPVGTNLKQQIDNRQ
ncbi:prepilin-type N-terminal cleavage/methylation domain-containing protein [Opitutaceae bacterium TAV1]|nr:prepilin-type N-terminal cleavage/methylation domain-containing protein [Opitutaceae bacterium TAV1]